MLEGGVLGGVVDLRCVAIIMVPLLPCAGRSTMGRSSQRFGARPLGMNDPTLHTQTIAWIQARRNPGIFAAIAGNFPYSRATIPDHRLG